MVYHSGISIPLQADLQSHRCWPCFRQEPHEGYSSGVGGSGGVGIDPATCAHAQRLEGNQNAGPAYHVHMRAAAAGQLTMCTCALRLRGSLPCAHARCSCEAAYHVHMRAVAAGQLVDPARRQERRCLSLCAGRGRHLRHR